MVEDFKTRAKQYINYGLGQEKKLIDHLKNESDENEDLEELIRIKEKWLETQKYAF